MVGHRGPRRIPAIDRLVLTVDPVPGTSLVGYAVTLARLNVYRTASLLFQGKDHWWFAEARASAAQDISRVSGMNQTAIRDLSNRPDADGFVPFGQLRISSRLIRSSYIHICPVCWASRKYVARIFELRYVSVCTEHRVQTVHRCQCGAQVQPNCLVQNECSKCKGCYDLCLPRLSADPAYLRVVYAFERMIEEGWNMLDQNHPFFRGFHKGRQYRMRDRLVGQRKNTSGVTQLSRTWDALVKHDWLEDGSPNPKSNIPIEGRIPRHWIYRG